MVFVLIGQGTHELCYQTHSTNHYHYVMCVQDMDFVLIGQSAHDFCYQTYSTNYQHDVKMCRA